MGGDVTVSSEVGRGSTFTLTFMAGVGGRGCYAGDPPAAPARCHRRPAARHARDQDSAGRRQRGEPAGRKALRCPAIADLHGSDQRAGGARPSPRRGVRPGAARRPYARHGRQGSHQAYPSQRREVA